MIDRLIAWWNRPLDEAERRRMFAFAALALVALAVLLIARQQEEPVARRAAAPAPPPPEAQPPARAVAAQGSEASGEERDPPKEDRYVPTSGDVADAKRAARRFLAGYLPYTYGRGDAERIRSANPALGQELARQPPRVPPTVARTARPRTTTLQAETAERDGASVLALVADGKRRYTIELWLEREGSEWRVADISG